MEQVSVVFGALAALIVAFRAPGFLAGLAIGSWYVLPQVAAPLAGFAVLLMVLIVCLFISWARDGRRPRQQGPRAFLPFLLLTAAVAAHELLGNTVRTTWAPIGTAVVVGLLLVLIGTFERSRAQLLWGFIAPNVVFAIAEIYRVANGGALHTARIAFEANPIFAAHFVGFALLALLYLHSAGKAPRIIFVVVLPILAGAILLTLSRGPILALAVSLLYWLLFALPSKSRGQAARRNTAFLLGVIGAVILFILLSDARSSTIDRASTEARTEHWTQAWSNIFSSPLWGLGTDQLFATTPADSPSPWQYPHNVFLETWSTYGLLAFLLLTVGVVWIFHRCTPQGRAVLIFTVMCFSVSGTMSISINFWVGIAIGITVGFKESMHADTPPPVRTSGRVTPIES